MTHDNAIAADHTIRPDATTYTIRLGCGCSFSWLPSRHTPDVPTIGHHAYCIGHGPTEIVTIIHPGGERFDRAYML